MGPKSHPKLLTDPVIRNKQNYCSIEKFYTLVTKMPTVIFALK